MWNGPSKREPYTRKTPLFTSNRIIKSSEWYRLLLIQESPLNPWFFSMAWLILLRPFSQQDLPEWWILLRCSELSFVNLESRFHPLLRTMEEKKPWRKKSTCVLFIRLHSLRGVSHLEVPKTFLLPFDKVLTCQKIPDLDSQSVMFYKQIHPLNPFRHDPTQKHINSHFLYAQLELWHSCWDYVISKLVLAGPQKTGCALQ